MPSDEEQTKARSSAPLSPSLKWVALLGLLGVLAGFVALAAYRPECVLVSGNCLFGAPPPPARADYITIASATRGETYHKKALSICRAINDACAGNTLRCVVETTDGSRDNIAYLERGDVDVALVQSDVLVALTDARPALSDMIVPISTEGGAVCEPEAEQGLTRAATHDEALYVYARQDDDMQALSDLEGRALSLGPAGSGSRKLAEALLNALGITYTDIAGDWAPFEQVKQLCNREIDAALAVLSAEAPRPVPAIPGCKVKLLSVPGDALERLGGSGGYLRYTNAKLQDGGEVVSNVVSIGPFAVLSTSRAACTTKRAYVQAVRDAAAFVFARDRASEGNAPPPPRCPPVQAE